MAELMTNIEFTVDDYRRLDDIGTEISACRDVAAQAGRSSKALSVFLKMVDDRLSALLKEFKERMRVLIDRRGQSNPRLGARAYRRVAG